MLAGGTQMLAVYSLMTALAETEAVFWRPIGWWWVPPAG